ncbi:MAG: SDR family NAD(P)-dependent oxidoreductase [Rhodoferax sp.]
MKRTLTILTGASRGMGQAMATLLLQRGGTVLCIARQTAPALLEQAQAHGAQLLQWQYDLAEPQEAAQALQQWLCTQASAHFTQAALINNAGLIPPLVPLAQAQPQDTARALRVGLEAPMLLCSAFLQGTEGWAAQRRILNISSGLGRRPMASMAAYCAAKAGLDHFSRCLALDQAHAAHPVRVCSLAPGVIDTDMQLQLRSGNAQAFPDQGSFAQLHQRGQLSSAQAAAQRVLAWLDREDFGQPPVADVREG